MAAEAFPARQSGLRLMPTKPSGREPCSVIADACDYDYDYGWAWERRSP